MPRIKPIDPQQAQGKSRALLEAIRAKLGMTPSLVKTMAASAATLEGYLGLSGALSRGSLSQREREQIALAVSEANGCRYCLAAHSAMGKLVGLSELEVIDARRGGATSTRENVIVALAGELVAQHGRVADESLRRARDAGLTDGELTEIVASVALTVFTNYLNLVAETDIDFPAAPALETTQEKSA